MGIPPVSAIKIKYEPASTKTAGVPQSNGTTLSDGRNAREAQELNKLSINATEFLQHVRQSCHETSPDSILQAPSNA
jgi:hypothetical protein